MSDEWVSRQVAQLRQSRQQRQHRGHESKNENTERLTKTAVDKMRVLSDLDDASFDKRVSDLRNAAEQIGDPDAAEVLQALAAAAEAEHTPDHERERRAQAAQAAQQQRKARNHLRNRITYLRSLTGNEFQNVLAEVKNSPAWHDLDERDRNPLHAELKNLEEREQLRQKTPNRRERRQRGMEL